MLHDIFEEPHGKGSSRGKTSGEQAGPGKDTYRHWFFPRVGRHRVPGSSGVLLERFGGAAKVHTRVKPVWSRRGPVRTPTDIQSVGGISLPPLVFPWGGPAPHAQAFWGIVRDSHIHTELTMFRHICNKPFGQYRLHPLLGRGGLYIHS